MEIPPIIPSNRRSISSVHFEPPRRPEVVQLDDGGCFSSPLGLGGARFDLDASQRIRTAPGTPIVASASGTVVERGDDFLVIAHASGYRSRYAGLAQPEAEVGDLVLRGQSIGQTDSKGRFGFAIEQQGKPLVPEAIVELIGGKENR